MARNRTRGSQRRTPSSRRRSPPVRDDGRRPEDRQSELARLQRREERWPEYHGDASGVVSGELRRQAIDHAERLSADGLSNPDPGGARPRTGFEVITSRGTSKATARHGQNPRPRSSFGFASDAVEVRGPADLGGAVLKIALDPELANAIDPATIRVFALDETSREWQLVPRSGAAPQAGYVWAHLHRPGLCIAIGLRSDAQALVDVLTLRALMPRLRAAEGRNGRRDMLALFDTLMRPAGRTKARPLGGGIRGLDISDRGLPEFDLLDELYRRTPPPPGKAIGAEIIAHLRSHNIHVDPGHLLGYDWLSIGPRNFSGRIRSLAIHPIEGNSLLAGTADGGVWRTSAGGPPWYPLMSQELSLAIGGVAQSSSNPAVIYAATGLSAGPSGFFSWGVGVYKSIDGGATWTLLAPIPSHYCTRVLIHPTQANTVYVSGNAGLHKSTDGGASWTTVRSDHVSDMVMDPVAPDTIFAGVWNTGVFVTTDGGESWWDFNEGLPTGTNAVRIRLAISDPASNGVVRLVAKLGYDGVRLFTRRLHVPFLTRAALFREPHFPLGLAAPPWEPVPGENHGFSLWYNWASLVGIDPTRHVVLFAGGDGLDRSGNFGATFSRIEGTHGYHHAIVFARRSSDLCYMATDGGVYRSTDNGKTWKGCSTGLVATQLQTIGVSQTAPFLLGGSIPFGEILTTSGSPDWVDIGAGVHGRFFVVDPNNSNNIYTMPSNSGLLRSTDGGSHWTTIVDGIPVRESRPTVDHLAVCPGNSNLLLCSADDMVFRSTDQGAHWSNVEAPSLGIFRTITQVAWYGTNTCYATSDDGDVVRSQQQGAPGTWLIPYASTDAPPRNVITAIDARFVGPIIGPALARRTTATAVPVNRDLVYIAYGAGLVYKSRDGGVHWSNASGTGAGALPQAPIRALVIDKDFSDIVYVGTDIGVFRTRDGGANWEPFNDGLPRIAVSGLVLRRANNTLYASTMGRGAYQRVLS